MLSFHDEPVIRENIIAKILFASYSAKISYRENFRVYGINLLPFEEVCLQPSKLQRMPYIDTGLLNFVTDIHFLMIIHTCM